MTQQAEILVVAAGKRGLIDSSHVRPGSVVIDVGMHRTEDGKLAGDVQFEDVAPKVAAITPVPGGVGPMTIAVLLQNTIRAAELREA
jgi:methylenetetrahydrofolate dehydrogenase (NADP+)/methenyltetrahydrofolate cyclohydrolase